MGTEVTVLGLGAMGSALAGAFVGAGHRTAVWNRTPGPAEALADRGAVRTASAAEAVAASPLVVVCVSDHDAVEEVLGLPGVDLTGRTLVNLTSGSPPAARKTAAWAEGRRVKYLDGAVMATPSGIGDPAFMQLYAGSRADFEDSRRVLAALGDPVYLGADPALPSVYDTALLGLLWSALTGWLHGVALLGADGPGGGVPAAVYTEVAGRWLDTVGRFMSAHAPQVDAGRYAGGEFPLELHRRTVEILVHAGELRGISSGMPELIRDLIGRAVAAGHGGDSFARLVEFMRPGPAGAAAP
ncbi:NAD(P)-binding domain-containing protein [Streptomyces sp. NPDC046215]|uniref:NAD(P)-binding domain-containing protein n=1 Tax=Streptomyces stramineus TaxID=173861 RepID=A0ABN0ZEI2_9ACTN